MAVTPNLKRSFLKLLLTETVTLFLTGFFVVAAIGLSQQAMLSIREQYQLGRI
jgi:hypothetical protein